MIRNEIHERIGRGRGIGRGDDDPLSGVANLFDVAMVFALGVIVMLLMYLSNTRSADTDRYNNSEESGSAEHGSDS